MPVIFDFFRYITTTYFKPPKPTMERLERRQEEWRRKYMPYATSPTSPKPTPSSLPPHTPARVVKPPSPPITPPKISPPKIPSIHDIMGFSQQIRRELRREGVPVWTCKYPLEIHAPTPERLGMAFRYIFGFASKLAERVERKYEGVVVQPVLAKVAPEKFTTVEKVREWKERIPQKPKVWSITERTPRGFVTTTYTQKGWKETTHREVLKEIKPAPLTPIEQVRRGIVGGLLRTPIALTGIPILRMGFKGIATPSGLKKEFGEMVKYAKKRPFEVGAETATTLITGGLAGRVIRVREPFEVSAFEKISGKLTRRYIPKERIVPEGLKFSTLRMPKTTPTEVMKKLMEEREFKLSGRAEEVWHAASFRRFKPSLIRGISEVPPGHSPVKGTYVAPAAYPAFATPRSILLTRVRVPPELRSEFEPTFFRIMTKGIEIPKRVKVTPKEIARARREIGEFRLVEAPYSPKLALKRFAEYKKYVEEVAPKGYAYVSPEVTAKIPWYGELEVEAVIPVGTKVRESLMSRLFPKFTEQEAVIARPTFRGELTLRRFYRQVKKALKQARTPTEREKVISAALSAEQKVIGEMLKRGWIKEKWGKLKVNVRSLRVLTEKSRINSRNIVKKEFERFGDASERFLQRRRGVVVVPMRGGRWEKGAYTTSLLLTSPLSSVVRRGISRGFVRRREEGGLLNIRGLFEEIEGFEGYEERVSTPSFARLTPLPSMQTRREFRRDIARREFERFGKIVRRSFSQTKGKMGRVGGVRGERREIKRSLVSSPLTRTQTRWERGVTERKFSRFRGSIRRISGIRESNIARISRGRGISTTFFTIIRSPEKRGKRRKRGGEFEFRKMLEEGVASKFLKITPIASPEELLRGVLRR